MVDDPNLTPKEETPLKPGHLPAAPGGYSPDAQVEYALYGGGVPRLHGLLDLLERQRFPTTKEDLLHHVGEKELYLMPDVWVPVRKVLDQVPDECFRSVDEMKEYVAAHWPSLSPQPASDFH